MNESIFYEQPIFSRFLRQKTRVRRLQEERIENWVDQLIDEGFMEGGGGSTVTAETNEEPVVDAVLAKLEADSSVLDESIAAHDTGFIPHTNPSTGKTMWTSPDGRSSYTTDSGVSTVMKIRDLYF